ncbi:MAG: diguanylate cyclase, partial [Agrobacterium sp.]|nr:diguanylate cyclase [Agrobacterium sp.]
MDSFIERVAALQGATPVLIALYDSEDRLRHANPSFQESFQITPEEFPTWADIMRLNHRLQTGVVVRHRDFEGWLLSAQSRRGKLPYRAFEMDMYDGRWFWMTETVQQDGWMLCIASDVTELRQGYRALRQDRDLAVRASQTDELTGTANRRFVFAKLALQVERVGKGLEAPFCLC